MVKYEDSTMIIGKFFVARLIIPVAMRFVINISTVVVTARGAMATSPIIV